METGRVVETMHGKMRSERLEVIVVAAANDISDLPKELLSRFIILRFKPYKWGEFLKIARNILVKREKIKPRVARYIAAAVWSKIGSKDFRDVIKIARLVKNKQTRKEVNTILKTIIKYS
jgi:Holliday junction DNA helicase RuvB